MHLYKDTMRDLEGCKVLLLREGIHAVCRGCNDEVPVTHRRKQAKALSDLRITQQRQQRSCSNDWA